MLHACETTADIFQGLAEHSYRIFIYTKIAKSKAKHILYVYISI